MPMIARTVSLSFLAFVQCIPAIVAPLRRQHSHDERHASTNSRENNVQADQVASKFVWRPKHRTLGTIHDDLNDPALNKDVEFVDHKMFGVSIPAYRRKDLISNAIRRDGGWDLDDVHKICDAFAANGGKGNILDVGANIGSYSLPLAACLKKYARKHCQGCHVISIEGYPLNAQHLRVGIKHNRFDNIELYEYAVGAPVHANQGAMKEYKSNEGMNRLKRPKPQPQAAAYISKLYGEVVPTTTIDSMMANNLRAFANVFLMKMDIEGSEEAALEGAQQFLQKGPCVIFVETKYNTKLTSILEGNGYVVKSLYGDDKNAWLERHDYEKCVKSLA